MPFELKNKGTEIAAERTIQQIEELLAKFGASQVIKDYMQDGRCTALSFKLSGVGYKMPANIEGVYANLYHENTRKNKDREDRAYRVCWRIIKDWLHAQLSLVASGQAQPDQVLLPYVFNGKITLYEAYKNGKIQIGDGAGSRSSDASDNGKVIDG